MFKRRIRYTFCLAFKPPQFSGHTEVIGYSAEIVTSAHGMTNV